MTDAAVMRIETVDETPSFLIELNAMNRAMALMCKNLKEFKSYMPQTLGLDDIDIDMDDDATASEASAKTSMKGSDSRSIASFMSRSASRAGSNATKTAIAAGGVRSGLVLTLQKRKFSFGVCNVGGWLKGTSGLSDAQLLKLHGAVLSLALSCFAANKGVSEMFSGDRFVASFNATRNCGTHRASCVTALYQIVNKFTEEHGKMFTMHAAGASGDGRLGNCGNEQMKRYTFMSPVLSWAYGLERIAAAKGFPLLVDKYVYTEVAFLFQCKVLFDVVYEKRAKKNVRVALVVAEHNSENPNDEWMYELEDKDSKDPFSAWNFWADSILDQHWEVARETQAEAEKLDSTSADHEVLLAQMEEKKVAPVELLFH